MPIKLNGSTSGYTQIQAAATAANNTLTLPNSGTNLLSDATLPTTTPTNGQIPIGNGTTYVPATITAGTGISVTNGAGSISIAATGGGTVTSVATSGGLTGGTITTSGTISINTNNYAGIGAYATTFDQSGTRSVNATYSASSIGLPSGTWRCMNSNALTTGTGGCGSVSCTVNLWIRTV